MLEIVNCWISEGRVRNKQRLRSDTAKNFCSWSERKLSEAKKGGEVRHRSQTFYRRIVWTCVWEGGGVGAQKSLLVHKKKFQKMLGEKNGSKTIFGATNFRSKKILLLGFRQ